MLVPGTLVMKWCTIAACCGPGFTTKSMASLGQAGGGVKGASRRSNACCLSAQCGLTAALQARL